MSLTYPYFKLAEIYDQVMEHVDYKAWSAYIEKLAGSKRSAIRDVLDLSCGTGKHLQHFPETWSSFGADQSYSMVNQARQKNYNHRPALFVQRAPELAIRDESFDLVTMLYDSINYVLEKDAVVLLEAEIARILKPGGIFIFDVVTRDGLLAHMDDFFETNTWGGQAYQREAWFEPEKNMQCNAFSLYFNGEMYHEIHRQKIRSLAEWTGLFSRVLNIEATYADFSFKPANDSNIRIHFLCSKNQT